MAKQRHGTCDDCGRFVEPDTGEELRNGECASCAEFRTFKTKQAARLANPKE